MPSFISLSLQLAGSVALLLFAISTRRDRVVTRFAAIGNMSNTEGEEEVRYSKSAFEGFYREAYLSKIAFGYLASGYLLSLFAYPISPLGRAIDFVLLIILSAVLIVFACGASEYLVERLCLDKNEITASELKDVGVEPHQVFANEEELLKTLGFDGPEDVGHP